MCMIKVEKKIKVPKKHGGGPKGKYPWNELKVGDSFFIPNSVSSPYSSLYSYNTNKAKIPIKITTRKENGGLRVWRIA